MNHSPVGIDLLLWCCAGCIRGDDQSTAFYSALNLPPSASSDDIRKAWRSISLRFHPDKLAQRGKTVTAEDQAMFAKAKDAHNVLSDPLRRRLYDSYGANGIKWSDDPSSIDPHVIYKNFTSSTTQDRARVVFMFALVISFILLFPLLLCVKVDGGSNLPWVIVALPLLLIESLWLVLQLVGLTAIRRSRRKRATAGASRTRHGGACDVSDGKGGGGGGGGGCSAPSISKPTSNDPTKEDDPKTGSSSDEDEGGEPFFDDADDGDDPWRKRMAAEMAWVGVVGTGLALLWQGMLVAKLQLNLQGLPYSVCLLPLLASELLSGFHNARIAKFPVDSGEGEPLFSANAAAADEEEGKESGDSKDARLGRVAMQMAVVANAKSATKTSALRAAFVVLLAFKLSALSSSSSSSDGGGDGGGGGGWSWWLVFVPLWLVFAQELRDDALSKGPSAVCHACFGVGFFLLSAVLACARLAGASFSACWVFFPVFAVGGCAMLCVTCVVCCAVDVDEAPAPSSSAPSSSSFAPSTSSNSPNATASAAGFSSPWSAQGRASTTTENCLRPPSRTPTPEPDVTTPLVAGSSTALGINDLD